MKFYNFVVTRRPRLAEITEHPKMEFADYERRLTSLQGVLQLVQQAYRA
jgi:AMP-polyphosphate phosphotransferase